MTPAVASARKAGIEYTLHEYAHDPGAASYGREAAEKLGLGPDEVYKTLVASVDGQLVVAIVPVDNTLDLKSLAAAVRGKRAEMAELHAAERATGYVSGGISPLGQRKRLRTVLDASAAGRTHLYVSAGRRGLQMRLAPADLQRLTAAVIADIAR